MKKFYYQTLAVLFTLALFASGSWAQNVSPENEFTLEEITVTAEKRVQNLQDTPSSVTAIAGSSLMESGKYTTPEILANIPNVMYSEYGSGKNVAGYNPDGGISIRGLKYRQRGEGHSPSATATYVDGVFQGAGGNFDISRIEVLRGPQGTLYGRSATAGVVAFYTNDPILSQFSTSISGEIGTANLRNANAVVNVPLGDAFALRVAGHMYERDGFFNPDGKHVEKNEGRIKALYQPSDDLKIVLSGTAIYNTPSSGGLAAYLTGPSTIDYDAKVTSVLEGGTQKHYQGALNIDYNLGGSALTYIGSIRHYKDNEGPGTLDARPTMIENEIEKFNGENFATHEVRWASDTEGRFNWILGTNFFNSDYDRSTMSYQVVAYQYAGGPEETDPNTQNALVWGRTMSGEVANKSIFTEDTFNLRDDLRITGGLRYDKTEVLTTVTYVTNLNMNENHNNLNPVILASEGVSAKRDFNNITYKFRVEYDLTPENMLYALTATGFQPGDVKLNSQFIEGVQTFIVQTFDEEKLTTYEVGTKNRFLDNTLQMNLSAFYYDYDNYPFQIDTATSGPPNMLDTYAPLKLYGAELDMEWLVTMKDRFTFTAGMQSTELKEIPTIPGLGSLKQWCYFSENVGVPKYTANLGYDHVFFLADDSTLTARTELHYTDKYLLTNLTQAQLDMGQLPYATQDSYVTGDIGVTWNSSSDKYSASLSVKNITDKEYKTGVTLSTQNTQSNAVKVGDPRVWQLSFSAKF